MLLVDSNIHIDYECVSSDTTIGCAVAIVCIVTNVCVGQVCTIQHRHVVFCKARHVIKYSITQCMKHTVLLHLQYQQHIGMCSLCTGIHTSAVCYNNEHSNILHAIIYCDINVC